MSELNESAPASRSNPLLWIALVVIGLILFVFLGGDREDPLAPPEIVEVGDLEFDEGEAESSETAAGTINRSLLVPPGMRAREYIDQLRSAGKPYPLSQVYERAQAYQGEGSLADAHLLYFFAAREAHLPAMMAMAEMADPQLFRAQDSLLDQADLVQAHKWYSKAAQQGHPEAAARLDALRTWATAAAAAGNAEARQFLLNFQ
jgi:hypothetical protein